MTTGIFQGGDASSSTFGDTAAAPVQSGQEVVFIDMSVSDYQTLADGVRPGVEVVLIDGTRDGLRQIAEALAGRSGIAAVHVISHGSEGLLALGSARVTLDNLDGYSDQLATIRSALSGEADLMLYGCNVGAGETGIAFISALAEATGADVAASEGLTGSSALGGDWQLEMSSGSIEAAQPLTSEAFGAYAGVLATSYTVQTGWSNPLDAFGMAAGTTGSNFIAGDFNGDGLVDMAMRKPTNDGIDFWRNNGNGTFTQLTGASNPFAAVNFASGTGFVTNRLAIGDFDNDGDTDIFSAGYNTLYRNDGASFSVQTGASNPLDAFGMAAGTTGSNFIAGDFNGDGLVDMAMRKPTNDGIDFWRNNGNGTFTQLTGASNPFAAVNFASGTGFVENRLAIGDFDNDGDTDIFSAGYNTLYQQSDSPPTIVSSPNGHTIFPVAGNIQITFSETIVSGGEGVIEIRRASDNALIETIAGNSSRVTGFGTSTISIDPSTVLVGNTTYYVVIGKRAFFGSEGQTFMGLNDPTGIRFTTDIPVDYNDPAEVTVPAAQTVAEDTTLSFTGTRLITVEDPDDNGGTLRAELRVANGTLSVTNTSGVTGNNSGTLVITGTEAHINAVLSGLSYRGSLNFSGSDSLEVKVFDNGNTGERPGSVTTPGAGYEDGSTNKLVTTRTVGITVTPVNDAPVLGPTMASLPGTTEHLTSGYKTVAEILGSGTVSDADPGTTLGIAVTSAFGGGAWQYSIDGSNWLWVGAVSYSAALLLGPNAMLRYRPSSQGGENPELQFRAWDMTSGTPSTAQARNTANTTLPGGSSAFSTGVGLVRVTVENVNDAPTLTGLSASAAYAEGAAPTRISPAVTLSDVDSPDFNGGSLTLALTSGGEAADRLSIQNQGTGAGQIGFDGTNVTYGGALIGTVSGGDGTNPLVITFTSPAATRAAVEALIENLTFASTSEHPDNTPRTARLTLVDGDGTALGGTDTYVSPDIILTVSRANDDPAISGLGGSVGHIEGGAATVLAPGAALSDADLDLRGNWAGATLTLERQGGADANDLFQGSGALSLAMNGDVVIGATTVGTWSAATAGRLQITFNTNATPALVDQVAQNIAYRYNGDTPPASVVIGWTLSDGNTGVSDQGTTGIPLTGIGSVTVNLTAVNDAPVLADRDLSLTLVEDAGPPVAGGTMGILVSDLVGGISDPDLTPGRGIAIVGADASNGTWWFSTDGGASWSALGTPSENAARLLVANQTTKVYFQPNADYNGTAPAGLTIRAWDLSAGSNGGMANIAAISTGGTTPFSAQTDTVNLTVTGINDAPVAINLTQSKSFTEDSGSVALDDIVVTDVDAGDTITATLTLSHPAAGTLSVGTYGATTATYNVGTGVWTVTGSVADVNAALAAVAFTPAANWDQSVTISTRIRDAANTGPADGTITLNATAVNDAPVLSDRGLSITTLEDAPAPMGAVGTAVTDLLAGFSDADTGHGRGIAITAANAANGSWWYSTNNGVTWSQLGTPSENAARLLGEAGGRVYFQPNPDYQGGIPAGLTIRAWDMSAGSSGGMANIAAISTGGTTPFSAQTDSVSLTVTGVNDAPVLADRDLSLSIGEDAGVPTGQVGTAIADLLAGFSDVDTGNGRGIAVTGVDAVNGTWWYSNDNGTTWQSMGSVSNSVARLIGEIGGRVYFQPASNFEGDIPAGLTFRAWDMSAGSNGSTANASAIGGSTAFSTLTESVRVTVVGVNDAPVLDASKSPALNGIAEDTASPVSGSTAGSTLVSALIDKGGVLNNFSDVDGNPAGIAITGVSGEGTLFYSTDNGATWTAAGAVSASSALVLYADGNTRLYFKPAANENGSISDAVTFKAWDRTGPSNGTTGVDTSTGTAFSTATDTASITVAAINDAPVATNLTQSKSFTEDSGGAIALDDIVVTDVDAGDTITATLTLSHPAAGMLSVGTYGAATATYNAGTGVWTVTGSVADVNAALAAVTFTPAANWDQSITISTRVRDAAGTGPADGTITLIATPVNDAPTATMPVAFHATEDMSTSLTGISFADIDAGSHPVTVTFTVGSGTLTATSASGVTVAGSGTGQLVLTGTIANINAFVATSGVGFRSAQDAAGNVSLTVTVTDDGGLHDTKSATIQVSAVNDAPVITAPAVIAATEDTATAITGLVFSDVDAGNGTVQVVLHVGSGKLDATSQSGVTAVGAELGTLTLIGTIADINAFVAGRLVTFTPGTNANGPVALTVAVNDAGNTGSGGALLDTTTVSIDVAPVNDAPTIRQFLAGLEINDTETGKPFPDVAINDPDGVSTILTATITLDKAGTGSLTNLGGFVQNLDGSYTLSGTAAELQAALRGIVFVPTENGGDPGQTVETTISLTVSDGNISDDGSLTIVVKPVNDTPAPVNDGPVAVDENGTVTADADEGVLANDTDADRDVLSVSGTSDGGGQNVSAGTPVTGFYGTLTLNADGSYAYVANTAATEALRAGEVKSDVFTYTVSDGRGGVTTATLTFEVTGVNDAATINGDDTGAVIEDGIAVAHGVLTVGDIDDGEASFQAQADQKGVYGTFSFDAATGAWTYTLDNDAEATQALRTGEVRTETFTVKAKDGTEKTVTVTVGGHGEPVDGVDVETDISTNPDGSQTQIISIPVVAPDRPEQIGNNTVADIPLVRSGTGASLLSVQVPTGFGLQATGSPTPRSVGASLTDLIREIRAHTPDGSLDQNQLTSGGSSFLQGLSMTAPLIVQTIVLTMASTGPVSNEPLVITGTPASTGNPMTALVIDARNLPAGTTIQLQNVQFAVVIGDARLSGGEGSQVVWGDGSSQSIVLGADDDTLHGGAGDDYVGSHGGNDYLYGDDGNDTVSGGSGDDWLFGGDGFDLLYGGSGRDRLYGEAGDDYLSGLSGNDRLYGGDGHDRMLGGSGRDRLYGGSGDDSLSGHSGKDYLAGNSGNDRLDGGASKDTLIGGNGEDTLFGGTGNDRLHGNRHDDRLYGDSGSDRLHGDTGDDYLAGGSGHDRLYGDTGNDRLFGGSGNDYLAGGSGRDVLIGGNGIDVLFGGAGRDSFDFTARLNETTNVDRIVDFNVTDDTIRLGRKVFTEAGALGMLSAAAFTIGSAATNASHRIVYDDKAGVLYYDQDGAGGAGQVRFATLDTNLKMTAKDFFVI